MLPAESRRHLSDGVIYGQAGMYDGDMRVGGVETIEYGLKDDLEERLNGLHGGYDDSTGRSGVEQHSAAPERLRCYHKAGLGDAGVG